jgi:hypothetical protein
MQNIHLIDEENKLVVPELLMGVKERGRSKAHVHSSIAGITSNYSITE